MNIYFVFLVDRLKNKILRNEFVCAKDESSAGAFLKLEENEKNLLAEGEYAIVTEQIASFESIKITRTKMVS